MPHNVGKLCAKVFDLARLSNGVQQPAFSCGRCLHCRDSNGINDPRKVGFQVQLVAKILKPRTRDVAGAWTNVTPEIPSGANAMKSMIGLQHLRDRTFSRSHGTAKKQQTLDRHDLSPGQCRSLGRNWKILKRGESRSFGDPASKKYQFMTRRPDFSEVQQIYRRRTYYRSTLVPLQRSSRGIRGR